MVLLIAYAAKFHKAVTACVLAVRWVTVGLFWLRGFVVSVLTIALYALVLFHKMATACILAKALGDCRFVLAPPVFVHSVMPTAP
jgi:hypothetical protein